MTAASRRAAVTAWHTMRARAHALHAASAPDSANVAAWKSLATSSRPVEELAPLVKELAMRNCMLERVLCVLSVPLANTKAADLAVTLSDKWITQDEGGPSPELLSLAEAIVAYRDALRNRQAITATGRLAGQWID